MNSQMKPEGRRRRDETQQQQHQLLQTPSSDATLSRRRQSLLLSEVRHETQPRRASRVAFEDEQEELNDSLQLFLERERSRRRSSHFQLRQQLSVDMSSSRQNVARVSCVLLALVVLIIVLSLYFKEVMFY